MKDEDIEERFPYLIYFRGEMSFRKPKKKDQLLFLTIYVAKSENNWVLFCENHPIFFDKKSLFVIQQYEENSKLLELFNDEKDDIQIGNIIFKNKSSENWKFSIFGISEFFSKKTLFEKIRHFFGNLFNSEKTKFLEEEMDILTEQDSAFSVYRNTSNTVIFNNDRFDETTVFEIQRNGQGSIFSIFYESEIRNLEYKVESNSPPRVCATDFRVFVHYEYKKDQIE